MRVMLLAFVTIAVIGVGSYFGLKEIGFSSEDRQVSQSVRID